MSEREHIDQLGTIAVPKDAYHGAHTARAMENFPLAGRPVHPELVKALGEVKLAAARVNSALGVWDDEPEKSEAIVDACEEMAAGGLYKHVLVDALQGGAGTSANMNVNEVIAGRSAELMGGERGDYGLVDPLEDVNRHQSTNDTFPTALKVAAIRMVRRLDEALVKLQESFQEKERELKSVVKVGRTQLQDAVLITLGMEMGAYAEAVNRDRWRVYKCEERLRVVNLGGTAIGTGLGAPRRYIFEVVERLREQTGIGLARAENMVEATQNADVFAEVSGILKTAAVNLLKITGDLRLMSSGPHAGLGELELPPRQAGSSMMPGKVNPVIPEAVAQGAMKVLGNDVAISTACAMGSLELNPFLPLVAQCLLESLDLLERGARMLADKCVKGIAAKRERCKQHLEGATAVATALLPALGYEGASELASQAEETGKSIVELVLERELLTREELEGLLSPEAVCRLGMP